MKTYSTFLSCAAIVTALALSSCEENVGTQSIVHEDGSIDRAITYSGVDSTHLSKNIFNATAASGWNVSVNVPARNEKTQQLKTINVVFRKHFNTVDAANAEMNTGSDTLFNLRSESEIRFRWFYTYFLYSDTYTKVNRFKLKDANQYFTPEDYQFIDRLPASGSTISFADSLFLAALTDKLTERFVKEAYFEESFDVAVTLLKNRKMDPAWINGFIAKKRALFDQLDKTPDDFDDQFWVELLDSLGAGIPVWEGRREYKKLSAPMASRLSFMSTAYSGKYVHDIVIPWDVVKTNADSVHGNELFWKPDVIKFGTRDYTMYVESRKMNYWAVGVTFIALVGIGYILFRGKPKSDKVNYVES